MSLLWTTAAAYQRTAMAWENHDNRRFTPIPVKKAGFAGLVGDQDWEDEMKDEHRHGQGGDGSEGDFDAYDEVRPEPTAEEQAHEDEHGEMPDSYYERHDQAYAQHMQNKEDENNLDHDDPELMGFVREHASNTKLWHNYGRVGKISLKQPVYATQSHVAREHIDRYHADPNDNSDHYHKHGDVPGREYLGDSHPMFVTHRGRLHTVEGHHRVAAALERHDPHIHGAHFNLDEHPQFEGGAGGDEE